MLFASLIIIYVPGLIWLALWLHIVKGQAVSLGTVLAAGALPFIGGDIAKSVAAAFIARGITPRADYRK
jgi:biotin transport system substrate-specific component